MSFLNDSVAPRLFQVAEMISISSRWLTLSETSLIHLYCLYTLGVGVDGSERQWIWSVSGTSWSLWAVDFLGLKNFPAGWKICIFGENCFSPPLFFWYQLQITFWIGLCVYFLFSYLELCSLNLSRSCECCHQFYCMLKMLVLWPNSRFVVFVFLYFFTLNFL